MSIRSPSIEQLADTEDVAGRVHIRRRTFWSVWLGVAIVYGFTLAQLPADGFWINDSGSKFIVVESIIRSDYRDFSIAWPGARVDPHFDFNPLPVPFGRVEHDRLYSSFSPFFPLLSSFPYRAIGSIGLYLLPVAGGLLTLPAVWWLAAMVAPDRARRRIAQPLAVGVTALGTPMWFYSVTFWEHTMAVCLTTWSIVFGARYIADGHRRDIAIAGAMCGAAIFFRDELYLFAAVWACVVIFARRRPVDGLGFAAGLLPLAVVLWWFQSATLGSAVGHHLTSLTPFEGGLRDVLAGRWVAARNLLLASHRDLPIALGVALPSIVLWIVRPRVSRRTFLWLVPAAAGFAVVAGGIIIAGHVTAPSPMRWLLVSGGLFATTPALVLAFLRDRDDASATTGRPDGARSDIATALWQIALVYPLLYVCLTPTIHSSGVHWGCRYLLSVFPVLAVLAAAVIAHWWVVAPARLANRSWVVLALVVTFATQIYGLHLLERKKLHSVELQRIVAERPEPVIVARGWYVPQELARVFFDKPIFLARDETHRARLIRRLQAVGYDQALMVSVPPTRDGTSTQRQLLSDAPLHFMTVELRNLSLDPDPAP